ncbi:MAG: glycyl-radical enzyme activating protein [Oscillospiraceae bacterium]|nr:glycyl-radical enzyme activating protein [Oscillospiraceae bacterium]
MSRQGLIFDIDRFSSHDGPGIRTGVFLKGCPLRCDWCHSPESQSAKKELLYRASRCVGCFLCVSSCNGGAIESLFPSQQSESPELIAIDRKVCVSCFSCAKACYSHALRVCGELETVDDIVETALQDKPFFDNSGGGVTVSGGEPLMQPGFTLELLSRCRSHGIHTALETCGYGSGGQLLEIAQCCDLIFFDVKLLSETLHRRYTGVGNELILNNLRLLCGCEGQAEKVVVRVPCIPQVNDSLEEIEKTAEFVRDLGIRRMEIMPYNAMAGSKYRWIFRPYPLEGFEPREAEHYENLREIVKKNGLISL